MNSSRSFRHINFLLISLAVFSVARTQEKKQLTVDWIYSSEGLSVSAVPATTWLKNGTAVLYDTRKPAEERTLEQFDPSTGKRTPMLDGPKALESLKGLLKEQSPKTIPFPTDIENSGAKALYVFGGDIFLLDISRASFTRITDTPAEEKSVNFSPDGKKISFVREKDLYLYEIAVGHETRVTSDGGETVLNATLTWVYWEEIFGRRDIGYWWSDDSRSLAFLRTDESPVTLQSYVDFKPWSSRVIHQRYPKVGEKNPLVQVGLYDLSSAKTTWIDFGDPRPEYIVRVHWLPDNQRVSVQTMNRLQQELDLYFASRTDGKLKLILKETNNTWINISDDLYFLKDGKHFIWSSQRDGYEHLYRYTMDGKLVNKITEGDWSIRSSGGAAYWVHQAVCGIDEKEGWMYFTALEKSSVEKQLYRIRMDGSKMSRISQEDGTHAPSFSPDSKYYFDRYSTNSSLPSLSLHRNNGATVQVIAEPRPQLVADFELQFPTLFTIPARDGFPLPSQVLKPKDFDPAKKYPVIFFVYGGPSAPQVANEWSGSIYFNNILLRNGFLVVGFDPRNATAISKKLEDLTFKRSMGEVELNDLVDAVHWVKSQPFVDSTRVGIWGWSGGGSYTLLALSRSAEFKAGIAVAGVSDHRFYDTKWAEASMQTEATNKEGYEDVSLLKYAKDLHGRLLMVHGTYDDNVHIQNTWAFADELIRANKRFEMMIYPMRMHGIADRPARIHLYSTMLDFWKRNL
ncbi:MAG: S9 family peptidase [Bacteroidota bacterium]